MILNSLSIDTVVLQLDVNTTSTGKRFREHQVEANAGKCHVPHVFSCKYKVYNIFRNQLNIH